MGKRIAGIVTALVLVFGAAAVVPVAAAETKVHKLAIHVDENDPKRMNLALNNAANVSKYYASKGEEVEIEIVAYGPGLHMLRADTSPVKQRIAAMSLEMPKLTFAACGNTMKGMKKKQGGKEVQLIPEAKVVTAGVVRLMELQEAGWSYLRP